MIAKTQSALASPTRRFRRAALCGTALCASLAALTVPAAAIDPANSTGAQGATVGGAPGAATITQADPRAIVDWSTMDMVNGETLAITTPTPNAITVNRVAGGNGITSIDGAITSTGRVWIIDADGVTIGPNGNVNSTGFLASTGTLDPNFCSPSCATAFGDIPLTGATGTVELAGDIIANGGVVALVSRTVNVTNQGSIDTTGRVVLAAADAVTIEFVDPALGLVRFQIDDDNPVGAGLASLTVDGQVGGSKVILTAAAMGAVVSSVINVTGTVTATNAVADPTSISIRGDTLSGTPHVLINDAGPVPPVTAPTPDALSQVNITGATLTTGGDDGIAVVGGSVTVAALTATGSTVGAVATTGNVTLNGIIDVTGGAFSAAATAGSATLATVPGPTTVSADGAVSIVAAQNVSVGAAGAAITSNRDGVGTEALTVTANFDAVGGGDVLAANGTLNGGTVLDRSNVTVSGASVTVGGPIFGGAIGVTATGAALSVAGIDGTSATLTAAGNATLTGSALTTGNLSITADSDANSAGDVLWAGALTGTAGGGIQIRGGAVDLTGINLSAGGTLDIAAPANITATGILRSNTDGVGAETLILFANSDSAGGGDILGGATFEGGTAANRSTVSLSGAGVTAGPVTGATISVIASSGTAVVGAVDGTGSVTITAGSDVTATGTVRSNIDGAGAEALIITANSDNAGSGDILGGATFEGGTAANRSTVSLTGAGVTAGPVTGAAISVIASSGTAVVGAVDGAGVILSAANQLILNGNISATANLTAGATSNNIVWAGPFTGTVGGTALLTAGFNADLSGVNLGAGGGVTITAAGDITATGSVRSNTDGVGGEALQIIANSDNLGDGSVLGGAAYEGGTVANRSNVTIAGNSLTIGNVTGATLLAVAQAGDASVGPLTGGGVSVFATGGVTVAGNISTSGALLIIADSDAAGGGDAVWTNATGTIGANAQISGANLAITGSTLGATGGISLLSPGNVALAGSVFQSNTDGSGSETLFVSADNDSSGSGDITGGASFTGGTVANRSGVSLAGVNITSGDIFAAAVLAFGTGNLQTGSVDGTSAVLGGGNNVTIGGNVTVTGNLTAIANSDNAGGGDLAWTSRTGTIAGDAVFSGVNIDLSGTAAAATGAVTLVAPGTIALANASLSVNSDGSGGGALTVFADSDNAGGGDVLGSGAVFAGGTIAERTAVSISGAAVTATGGMFGASISVVATATDAAVAGPVDGASVTLSAARDVTLTGAPAAIASLGGLTVLADSNTDGDGDVLGGTSVLSAGGSLVVSGVGVTVGDAAGADVTFLAGAGGFAATGDIVSNAALNLTSAGGITLGGDLTAGAASIVSSGGGLVWQGGIGAFSGNLILGGTSLDLAGSRLSATGSMTLSATTGGITLTNGAFASNIDGAGAEALFINASGGAVVGTGAALTGGTLANRSAVTVLGTAVAATGGTFGAAVSLTATAGNLASGLIDSQAVTLSATGDLALTGAVLARTGDLFIAADSDTSGAGDVSATSALTATLGNVSVSGRNATLNGAITAGTSVNVAAPGNVVMGGAVTAGSNIGLTAGGALTWTNRAGVASTGSLTASGASLTLDGSTLSAATALSLAATGNISLASTTLTSNSAVGGGAQALTIVADSDNNGTGNVGALGAMLRGGSLAERADVLISGASVTTGVVFGANATLNAKAGDLFIANAGPGALVIDATSLSLSASGNASLTGLVTAPGAMTVGAGGTVSWSGGATIGGGLNIAAGSMALNGGTFQTGSLQLIATGPGTTGNINLSGTFTSPGKVELRATNDIALFSSTITADSDSTGDTLTVTADSDGTLTGSVTTASPAVATLRAGPPPSTGNNPIPGAVSISGASVSAGTITGSAIGVRATAGGISLTNFRATNGAASIVATGAVSLSNPNITAVSYASGPVIVTGQSIDVTTSLASGLSLNLTAPGTIRVSSQALSANTSLGISGSNVNLNSALFEAGTTMSLNATGAMTIQGNIRGAGGLLPNVIIAGRDSVAMSASFVVGSVSVTSNGPISGQSVFERVTGALTLSGTSIQVHDIVAAGNVLAIASNGGITVDRTISATAGPVALLATGGAVSLGGPFVPGNVTATGAVTLAGTAVTSTGSLSGSTLTAGSTAGGISIGGNATATAGAVNLDATGGGVNAGNVSATGGSVSVTGQSITLASASGTNVTGTAASGALTVSGAINAPGGVVTLSASGALSIAATTARSVTLTAADIALGGALAATGDLTVNANHGSGVGLGKGADALTLTLDQDEMNRITTPRMTVFAGPSAGASGRMSIGDLELFDRILDLRLLTASNVSIKSVKHTGTASVTFMVGDYAPPGSVTLGATSGTAWRPQRIELSGAITMNLAGTGQASLSTLDKVLLLATDIFVGSESFRKRAREGGFNVQFTPDSLPGTGTNADFITAGVVGLHAANSIMQENTGLTAENGSGLKADFLTVGAGFKTDTPTAGNGIYIYGQARASVATLVNQPADFVLGSFQNERQASTIRQLLDAQHADPTGDPTNRFNACVIGLGTNCVPLVIGNIGQQPKPEDIIIFRTTNVYDADEPLTRARNEFDDEEEGDDNEDERDVITVQTGGGQ